ncbi:twin-arginine translocase subunit TatC [Blattabacterium cuenoti]|uniref:twin-arginine translocase subunit TatC n=1 Tax=Blattabacterium cuenoti TaxID=1653831 RepID=UPI00163CA853|nr:twin-arginine translocase subunit TatC [Blattabacterium cuenoti]
MNKKKIMPFWEHIEELRIRMIRCLFVIIIMMFFLMINKKILFNQIIFGPAKKNFITYRLLKHFTNKLYFHNLSIQNREIFGQFNIYIWICFCGGFILSFPYIFYELWSFISPAFSDKERIYSQIITTMVSTLFCIGMFFGYFILFPFLINFGYTFKISNFPKNIFDLSDYISLIINSVLLMGMIFLFPFFIFLLSKAGLISYSFLRKYRKHAFLIMLIISSAITPGDILSTIIVLIPLLILYQFSIFISFYIFKKKNHLK